MPTIPTFSNSGHAESVTDVALIRPDFLDAIAVDLPRLDPFPPDFIPRMLRAARDAAREVERVMRDVARVVNTARPYLSVSAAADSAHVAGLAATYAVRAGLDTPADALPALVWAITRGGGHPDAPTGLLTRENRAHVAAAALRGYVVGHPETVLAPVTSVVWTWGAPSTVTRAWPVPR